MHDGNVVETYFKEIRKFKPLTKEKELELTERIKNGDDEAKRALVEANLKFVVTIAKKYRDDDIPFEDIISEGNLGLIKAAERYDASMGNKFITYAVWWIKAYIQDFIERHDRNRDIDSDVLSSVLSDDLCDDDYERELIGINEEFGNTINDINYRENAISEMVASLETRERKILALYFGLDGDKEHTLNEIGCELNLSGERVRQIMDKAIVKLKCGALMNDELMAMVEMN
jgi:RNA polymerase primary sigma factor